MDKDDQEGRYEEGWAWLFLNRTTNLVVTAAACTFFELPLLKLAGLLVIVLTIVNLLHRIILKQNMFERRLLARIDLVVSELDCLDEASSLGLLLKSVEGIDEKLKS